VVHRERASSTISRTAPRGGSGASPCAGPQARPRAWLTADTVVRFSSPPSCLMNTAHRRTSALIGRPVNLLKLLMHHWNTSMVSGGTTNAAICAACLPRGARAVTRSRLRHTELSRLLRLRALHWVFEKTSCDMQKREWSRENYPLREAANDELATRRRFCLHGICEKIGTRPNSRL